MQAGGEVEAQGPAGVPAAATVVYCPAAGRCILSPHPSWRGDSTWHLLFAFQRGGGGGVEQVDLISRSSAHGAARRWVCAQNQRATASPLVCRLAGTGHHPAVLKISG